MNIFKWLTSKAGKLPVTVAQAAGLTAVVGAAGFAALNFLSGPEENNAFIPPSAYEQGDVVYVAQGPGSYDADGAAGSTFKAAPSRSIQLANRQDLQLRRAQELEGFSAQPTFEDPSAAGPNLEGKAHELSGGDMGLGMGGNKQIGNSLEILKNMPDQLAGLNDVVAQAQAAAGGASVPGAVAGASTSAEGGSGAAVPTLARASMAGGAGVRAGGGSGGSGNAFVVQNSGKNGNSLSSAQAAEAMAQAGDAIAQARATMTKMREGETLTSRANFGPSGGLSGDRNALVRGGRNLGGKGRNELAQIRKQSAAISANRTNAANAGTLPFMAGEKLSGGIVVSEDNVVIGQSASSGDLGGRSMSRGWMKGVQARLDEVQADMDEQEAARDTLKYWMLEAFAVTLGMSVAISLLVKLAKFAGIWSWIFYAAAGVLTAVALTYIWWGAISHITDYNATCGSDGWSIFGWALAGAFTASVGLAWTVFPNLISTGMSKLTAVALALVGLGGVAGAGKGIYDLADKGKSSSPDTEVDENHQTADEEN